MRKRLEPKVTITCDACGKRIEACKTDDPLYCGPVVQMRNIVDTIYFYGPSTRRLDLCDECLLKVAKIVNSEIRTARGE